MKVYGFMVLYSILILLIDGKKEIKCLLKMVKVRKKSFEFGFDDSPAVLDRIKVW